MARRFLALAAFSLVPALFPTSALAQQPGQRTGEQVFATICRACHTKGEGRLIGPDLKGVTTRRPTEWLRKFIRSSQSMVKSGDERAVAVFNYYDKTIMPDPEATDAEIEAVLVYLGAGAGGTAPGAAGSSKGDVARGRDIFQGTIRLDNGGPACNSCHNVTNDAVTGGGILAKDLTLAFSRLGGVGVEAVLRSPSFPVMARAYRDNPLEPEEVSSLVAFLEKADKENGTQSPRDYGLMLVACGLGGVVLLFALFGLLWKGRKQQFVNAAIYDRQAMTA